MGRWIAVLAVLLLAAGGAWAAPSLLGPTGLIFTPTADVPGTAGVNAQAAFLSVEGVDETVLSANVGISAFEVGAARLSIEDDGHETIINAKFKLLEPPLTKTRLAIGVIDLTDEIDDSPYVVLSHTLGLGYINAGGISNPEVHVGIGGGVFDGLFGGLSVTVAENVQVIAEWDSENLNLGARLPLAAGLTVTAAGLDGFDDFAVAIAFSTTAR